MNNETNISELAFDVFRIRRYHTAGNNPNDTMAAFRRRHRLSGTVFTLFAIVFAAPSVLIVVEMVQNFPRQPDDGQLFAIPLGILALFFGYLAFHHLFIRLNRGRWIITQAGLFHRYGKDQHRFLPWNAVVDVNLKKSRGVTVIRVSSVDAEIDIADRDANFSSEMPFLPFLNMLIERLRSAPVDLEPLKELRDRDRKRAVLRRTNPYLHEKLSTIPGVAVLMTLYLAGPVLLLLQLPPEALQRCQPFIPVAAIAVGVVCGSVSLSILKRKCREADDLYRSLTESPELVKAATKTENVEHSPFGEPPRTITRLARWRLLCRWHYIPAFGMALISLAIIVPGFFAMLEKPMKFNQMRHPGAIIGIMIFAGAIIALGGFLVWTTYRVNQQRMQLYANGRAVRGRIRNIEKKNSVLVVDAKGEPGSPFNARNMMKSDLCQGDVVDIFFDPSAPKEVTALIRLPHGVYYDFVTNTFDAETLPAVTLIFVSLFALAYLAEIGMYLFVFFTMI